MLPWMEPSAVRPCAGGRSKKGAEHYWGSADKAVSESVQIVINEVRIVFISQCSFLLCERLDEGRA